MQVGISYFMPTAIAKQTDISYYKLMRYVFCIFRTSCKTQQIFKREFPLKIQGRDTNTIPSSFLIHYRLL